MASEDDIKGAETSRRLSLSLSLDTLLVNTAITSGANYYIITIIAETIPKTLKLCLIFKKNVSMAKRQMMNG